MQGDNNELSGPDLSNVDEVECSFSSSPINRQFTECCNKHEDCLSGNCFQFEFCSEVCIQPSYFDNSLYLQNGHCCTSNRYCVSNFCYMGVCAPNCFKDDLRDNKPVGACCDDDN